MKTFKELIEAKETVVFTFGRFNPPTTGHEKLIQKVASVAGSNPFRIYPSYSQNQKKDPLPFALKIAYMRKMFPKYARNIVADKDARTAINIAVKLHKEGFKNLIMVAGSDRVKEFSSLLKTYNGIEGKRHGFYNFDTIDVVSAGERDPDAEGVAGMSASKMRAAASNGDFESFSQGLPSSFKDGKKLYTDVRKNMGIREERDMGEMNDFETLRDMYLTGKIWNVGDMVEANGFEGKVIRKGTNYLSFNDKNGKVHKAWLHEIKLDEALLMTVKGKGNEKYKLGYDQKFTMFGKGYESVGVQKQQVYVAKGPDGERVFSKKEFETLLKKGDVKMVDTGAVSQEEVELDEGIRMPEIGKRLKRDALKLGMKVNFMPTGDFILLGKADDDFAHHQKIAKKLGMKATQYAKTAGGGTRTELDEGVELDERNYASEYKNYHSRPEQIARRSSRNKARRVMGDKAVKGMDVGHKDNDPMNNDPKNLRNETPSDNRREPRLRFKEFNNSNSKKEYVKDIAHAMRGKGHENLKKYADEFEKNALKSLNPAGELKKIPNINPKQVANLLNMGDNVNESPLIPLAYGAARLATKVSPSTYAGVATAVGQGVSKAKDYISKKLDKKKSKKEEIDEMTGINVPELIKTTIHRLTHPKGYADLIKRYIEKVKSEKQKSGHQDTNGAILSDIATQMGFDRIKPIQDYVNKLVSKGKLPQALHAEYETCEEKETNLKSFEQLNTPIKER